MDVISLQTTLYEGRFYPAFTGCQEFGWGERVGWVLWVVCGPLSAFCESLVRSQRWGSESDQISIWAGKPTEMA